MKIGLIDVDGHRYPNLALMKLSAWHKARGDVVEWWWSDLIHFDIVYMSKVFSSEYSPDVPAPQNADRVIRGGTGYAIDLENGREVYRKELDGELPPEVECCCPDYSIYPELTAKTAYGFLTRGCPRGCGFCHVACKEGRASRRVADLRDFWTGQNDIKLMDPNILACPDRWVLLEQIKRSGARIDFNQGLDIRLTDKDVADALGAMRVKNLHFAWDDPKEDLERHFEKFTEWYRRKDHRVKNVYVLTNYGSTHEEDLYRVNTLRRLGYDPYVMIYNKPSAPAITRQLQRWCNDKIVFGAEPDFKKYDPNKVRKGKQIMKRALFDTVAVLPFESGSVTPRMGYESAILALTIAAGGKATVQVEHCDTEGGTYEVVKDSRLFVDNPVDKDGNAIVTNDAPADAVANLNIDLIGCKEFVKITVTGSEACALALGDATNQPVSL